MFKVIISIVSIAMLAGCATSGANYVPLVDMKGKDQQAFNADVIECQAYARQRMDAASGAAAGAVAGALLGALIAPRGYRNLVAGHTAIGGAAGGALAANETQETITKRCLAGRGYNVLN